MPIAVSSRRSASTLVIVVAAAALVAGCSNSASRFSPENLFAGSNASGATVEQRSLPPYSAAEAMGGTQSINQALAAKGWTTEGAKVVEVSAGDTPSSIATGFNVPLPILLQANGMSPTSSFAPGQRILVPRALSTATAAANGPLNVIPNDTAKRLGNPPTTLNNQARALGGAAQSYRVQPGDTLFSIARRSGTSMQSIATLNGLPADGTVKSGQLLRLPAGAGGATATQTVVASATPTVTAVTEPSVSSYSPSNTTITEPEAAKPNQPERVVAAPPAAAGGEKFRWPVRGRIIAGFGKQPDGARNDGINLAVPAGTPVKAAESGTVIYAGSELEGYGNLILVQHGDDWVSAYAHAESIKVSRGDRVQRGQSIATAGKTGSVDQPQLHFELRRNSRPVDPLPHLAGA